VAEPAVLWRLFHAVAKDGAEAWPKLLVELHPELALLARRQPIGRLRDQEDSPREIVTRALARLHARDFAAIKKLCAIDPPPELRAWLRVVVRHSAIDYIRANPEFQRASRERPARWVSLASLSSSAPGPVPDSIAEKRAQVLAAVRDMVARAAAEHVAHGDEAFGKLAADWKVARIHVRRLAKRGERYLAVLGAVLEGRSYPETAELVGITRREVELTVRYLEELLVARGFRE
jgi:DNA-directed RNA polymerase specialized sigma24 family protein